MAAEKIHSPWSNSRLKGIFTGHHRQLENNIIPMLALLLTAAVAIGIFVVNIVGLINSKAPAAPAVSTGTSEIALTKETVTEHFLPADQSTPAGWESIKTEPAPSVKTPVDTPLTGNTDRFKVDSYLYRARGYEAKGEFSRALINYQKVLEKERDNFIVLNNISYLYLQMDLLKESIEYSIRALSVNRDYVPAHSNIATAYAKSGEIGSAEHHYNRALEIEPSNSSVRLNLALLLEKEARFSEAAEIYSGLAGAGDMNGALGLGRLYEKEGRIPEAVAFYKKIYEGADKDTRAFVRNRILILQSSR